MMRSILLASLLVALTPLAMAAKPAATAPSTSRNSAAATEPATMRAESEGDKVSLTHHEITLDGQSIAYDATAGTLLLKDESGKPKASFFFVAYVKKSADPTTRPVTFIFNGGPGAAAVWLHLGAIGPKRIALQDDGLPSAPPHHLIDNPQSWLDLSDLVFIDPVGTGFSRAAEGQKPEEFYGVEQDIASVAQFIRLYTTRYQRWASPKFLAGESYGTTRAAGLSEFLLDRYGIDLNGIVLISTVLNFQTLSPAQGNDLPYVLYLPSYAAIAAYHHKLGGVDPAKLLPEVERFAMGDYAQALSQGGSLPKDARAAIVARLAGYTGLPAEFIDEANLRIRPEQFRQKLLEDRRLILGRYDARVTGYNPDPAGRDEYDPSLSIYFPVYTSTFNDYVRSELQFQSDLNYEVLTGLRPWDNGPAGQGYLDVTGDLRDAMLKNSHLKVLVCSGHEDLATAYLATNYTMAHLDPTGHLQANIRQTFYDSGHMIYHDKTALEQLKRDVTGFYRWALEPK